MIVGVDPCVASLPLLLALLAGGSGKSLAFTAGLPSLDAFCLSTLLLGSGGGAGVVTAGRFAGGGAKIRCGVGVSGTAGNVSFLSSMEPGRESGPKPGSDFPFGDEVRLDSAPDAMPQRLLIFDRRRGGTGGAAPLFPLSLFVGVDAWETKSGTSSSQTLSRMPVRMKAQSEHVVRRRARHHPDGHNG